MVNFIRRHNRWITFIGATFVLAMFIVKDEMGEQARQLADAVDSARSTAGLMREMTGIPVALDGIERLAYETASARDPKKYPKPEPNTIVATSPALSLLTALERDYGSNARLLSKLEGENPDLRDRLDKIKARLVRARKRLLELVNAEDPGTNRFEESVGLLEAQLNEIDSDLDDLAESILAEAEKAEKSAEQRAKYCAKASYVLFPAGWLLALVGKIYEKNASVDIPES